MLFERYFGKQGTLLAFRQKGKDSFGFDNSKEEGILRQQSTYCVALFTIWLVPLWVSVNSQAAAGAKDNGQHCWALPLSPAG